jgi:hypothetical protein
MTNARLVCGVFGDPLILHCLSRTGCADGRDRERMEITVRDCEWTGLALLVCVR